MRSALLEVWLPRWQALQHVSEVDWSRVTNFVAAFVPSHSLEAPALSSKAVLRTLHSGKGLRTGGPDGWRREDILSLPCPILEDGIRLFQHVESGADWPSQITRGHVYCLQKRAGNFSAANYRPIVVFSLWYRLWGCLRSRFLLRQLELQFDLPAFGLLAGRGCRDFTYALQCAIETAILHGTACCGVLSDIENCFNLIPRAPILFLAQWFGVPTGIITAWGNFLSGMRRSFVIHGHPSDEVWSDTLAWAWCCWTFVFISTCGTSSRPSANCHMLTISNLLLRLLLLLRLVSLLFKLGLSSSTLRWMMQKLSFGPSNLVIGEFSLRWGLLWWTLVWILALPCNTAQATGIK